MATCSAVLLFIISSCRQPAFCVLLYLDFGSETPRSTFFAAHAPLFQVYNPCLSGGNEKKGPGIFCLLLCLRTIRAFVSTTIVFGHFENPNGSYFSFSFTRPRTPVTCKEIKKIETNFVLCILKLQVNLYTA